MRLVVFALALGVATAAAAKPYRLKGAPHFANYTPTAAVQKANQLIKLGEKRAYAELLRLSQLPYDEQRTEKIVLLATLLYRHNLKKPVRGPALGAPMISPAARLEDWPMIPLAVHQGVPFQIVRSYMLGGHPEHADMYLKLCAKKGVFRKTPYAVPTGATVRRAAAALMASSRWKKLGKPARTTAHLIREQLARIKTKP